MAAAAQIRSASIDEGEIAAGKVFRRLIWFLFLLLVVSFIDRINVAFASLTMNKDLGLTAGAYGLSFTIFYAGYALCEIPSNLLLARFGARIWIARIMITWGIASAGTMFAVGAWSLYGWRAMTGIAEAGFLPGILLYLTYWFPQSYRARANSLFLIGIPTTIAISSGLSGLILQMDGFLGLAGWRWLFLLEGLPAVLLGFVCLFFLPDRPAKAPWLTAGEKAALQARLDRDRALEQGSTKRSIMSQLGSRNVVLLCIAYFGLVTSLNANSTWVPQIVRSFAGGSSYLVIGLLVAIPALMAVALMPVWGWSSDRRNERPWHIRISMLVAATGWVFVIAFDAAQLRYFGLCLVSVGSFCGLLTFWTLPANAAIFSPEARPAGIALINCIGIGGGSALSPAVIGLLKDWTGSFTPGLIYVVAWLAIAVVAITMAAAKGRVGAVVPQPST